MAASWVIVLQILYLFVSSTFAAADTYFIDGTDGIDNINCTSSSSPCLSLEYVLSIADIYSSIHFLDDYTLSSSDAAFDISNYALRGSTGVVELICSANYTEADTVFSTSGGTSLVDLSITNCPGRVLDVSNGATLNTLGLLISQSGQPLFALGASVTLEESSFQVSPGSSHTAVTLVDCTGNIRKCDFSGSISEPTSYPASALAISLSTITINTTTFSDCIATGATVYITESNVTLDDCDIFDNQGTGVHLVNSEVLIVNSRINNNNGTAAVDDDIINGAGIYAEGSVLNITDSFVVENSADNGAGLYIIDTTSLILDSNITANIGSGIYLDGEVRIEGGAIENIFFASPESVRTLRVDSARVTTGGLEAFCCVNDGLFDNTIGTVTNTVCSYPACNAAQCGVSGSGCLCPLAITEDQDAVVEDVCSCTDNFGGPFCTQYNCSADIYESCNYNGICDTFKGCECSETFYGARCDKYCLAELTCNGNGECNDIGECECNSAFSGPDCTSPVFLGSTSSTSGVTDTPTIPPPSTTGGRVITGNCRVYATLTQRDYSAWTENGVAYNIFDINLVNVGTATVTDLQVVIGNASVAQAWNMDLVRPFNNSNHVEYAVRSGLIYPSASYSAVGFVNEGLSAPALVSLSCNTTEDRPVSFCNGVKINYNIRNAYYDNRVGVVTQYDLSLTNRGQYSVVDLKLEITGTEGSVLGDLNKITRVNENNEYTLDGVEKIRVDQTVSGFQFNLLGRGSAMIKCANSAIVTGDEIIRSEKKSNRRRDGAIAGGVIGGVILLALIIALALFITRRRRHMVQIPSFERTSVVKKPRFGIESFGDGYEKTTESNPSAADQNL